MVGRHIASLQAYLFKHVVQWHAFVEFVVIDFRRHLLKGNGVASKREKTNIVQARRRETSTST